MRIRIHIALVAAASALAVPACASITLHYESNYVTLDEHSQYDAGYYLGAYYSGPNLNVQAGGPGFINLPDTPWTSLGMQSDAQTGLETQETSTHTSLDFFGFAQGGVSAAWNESPYGRIWSSTQAAANLFFNVDSTTSYDLKAWNYYESVSGASSTLAVISVDGFAYYPTGTDLDITGTLAPGFHRIAIAEQTSTQSYWLSPQTAAQAGFEFSASLRSPIVPEPASLSLACVAVAGLIRRRQRRICGTL